MFTENVLQISWLAAATYVGWYAAERLAVLFLGRFLTPYAVFLRAWITLLLLPLLFRLRSACKYRQQMRRLGAQPLPVYPHFDALLGLDSTWKMSSVLAPYVPGQSWLRKTLSRIGSTFWINIFGSYVLVTDDPAVFKQVLGGRLETWDVGKIRKSGLRRLAGPNSIFAAEGQRWEKIRARTRPFFFSSQMTDMICLNRHADHFIDSIPRDGKSIDLQRLLHICTTGFILDFMYVASPPKGNLASSLGAAMQLSKRPLGSKARPVLEKIEARNSSRSAASSIALRLPLLRFNPFASTRSRKDRRQQLRTAETTFGSATCDASKRGKTREGQITALAHSSTRVPKPRS